MSNCKETTATSHDTWLGDRSSSSKGHRELTSVTEIYGLINRYRNRRIRCDHAMCSAEAHSVIGTEETELRWLVEWVEAQPVPPNATHTPVQACRMLDEAAYEGTLYFGTTHLWLISELDCHPNICFFKWPQLHLVLGIGKHTFGKSITPRARFSNLVHHLP